MPPLLLTRFPSSTAIRSSLLVAFTLIYLLGQASAVWVWCSASPVWIGGSVLAVGLAWALGSRRRALAVAGLLLTFMAANLSFQRVLDPRLPADHLRHLSLPQEVTLEGRLFREPDRLPHRGRLYLEALHLQRQGVIQPARGKILLTVRSLSGPWRYGDVLRVTVRLRAPRNFHTPGSFDYESYLARQDIYLTAFLWDDRGVERVGWQGDWLRGQTEDARRKIGAFFSAHLDEHTAAVLRALIIGDEGGLTNDEWTAFSRAGVAHVLSISGLHISFVLLAAYGTWWWLLGRSRSVLLRFTVPKLAALGAIPPVLCYASLAGGNVATWRSVVMVVVYLLAIVWDRQHEVYRSLALAALLISLLWPGAVLDISFQLSFLSILSILLGMEQFAGWWERGQRQNSPAPSSWRERAVHWIAAYIAVSVYALLGTAPLTAFHFNQISVAGVLANLLVVPFLGTGAVLLGLLSAAALFVHAGLAALLLFCAGVMTRVGVQFTQWIGSWSFAAVSVVTPTVFELLLLYGVLACFLFSFSAAHAHSRIPRHYLLPLFTLLLLIDGLVWLRHRHFHADLRVTFLDVGQGDAAVIEFPGSQVMLIDGGGFASEEFDVGEAILAPFLWSRKIGRVDILVMSHPQLDHYGGLTFVAQHFAPREFWFTGERASAERFTRLWAALEQNAVLFRALCRDTPVVSLAEVHARILHPPCQQDGLDANNASLVLRLSHGNVDILFPGDLEAEGERVLLAHNNAVASEILKAPHHGSRTSSTAAFVSAVSPQLVVASLGYHNRFGFPATEVVRRYQERNGRFLRTDLDGAVSISSDGRNYTVEAMPQPSLSP